LPQAWQERKWISGFTGSYGYVVVTQDKAGLWTDGRYFTQAREQLQDTGIIMFKDRVVDAVNYVDWIISITSKNARVAVNALVTSHGNWVDLKTRLEKEKRQLVHMPLLDDIWKKRISEGMNPVFVQPLERAGESVESKLEKIRQKMKEKGATAHIISSLDDVAWTLNLRGSDVKCNPVFLSYLLIKENSAKLFVKTKKLDVQAAY